jgi:hypothetical protein
VLQPQVAREERRAFTDGQECLGTRVLDALKECFAILFRTARLLEEGLQEDSVFVTIVIVHALSLRQQLVMLSFAATVVLVKSMR